MRGRINPALIGAFVIGAVVIAATALMVAGKGLLTQGSVVKYVVYFDSSINGLSVGAPVKMKGVQIGTVTDIVVQFDADNAVVRTPVFVEVQPEKVIRIGGTGPRQAEPDIAMLIQQGLRAHLQLNSMVTGKLYIEVDFRPQTPIRLVGADNGVPEVPSVPSSVQVLEDTVTSTLDEFRELPIKELFSTTLRTLQQVEHLVSSDEVRRSAVALENTLSRLDKMSAQMEKQMGTVSTELSSFLSESRQLVTVMNEQFLPLANNAQQTLNALHGMAQKVEGGMQSIQALTDPAVGGHGTLPLALREITEASRSIARLTDYLQRHPEALIYGKSRE